MLFETEKFEVFGFDRISGASNELVDTRQSSPVSLGFARVDCRCKTCGSRGFAVRGSVGLRLLPESGGPTIACYGCGSRDHIPIEHFKSL